MRYSISKFRDFSGIFRDFSKFFKDFLDFKHIYENATLIFKVKIYRMPSDFQSQKFTEMLLQFLK